jgi:hypothetical protein
MGSRQTKPTSKEVVVAHAIFGGDTAVTACKKARYAPSTIKRRAAQIARSERVQRLLQQIAASIAPGELTDLSRGRIKQKLTSGERNDATMLKWVRTAMESEGALNSANTELHLHKHETITAEVAEMIAAAVKKAFSADEHTNETQS